MIFLRNIDLFQTVKECQSSIADPILFLSILTLPMWKTYFLSLLFYEDEAKQ